MTDPTTRAALEAAEKEPTTAGKITTFLRALAPNWRLAIGMNDGPHVGHLDISMEKAAQHLAAAVEEAARHE